MSHVFLNVLPVFILILMGWLSARSGYLKSEAGDVLGEFVFKIAVPILIFRTIATADFTGASPFALWGAYFGGVAVTWVIAHLMATRIFGRNDKIGVIASISACFANNVFIGLPLVDHLVGREGLVALSILIAIHLPIMMIAGTIAMERASAEVDGAKRSSMGAIMRQIGENLIRNPLVIAVVSSILFNLAGFHLTSVPGVIVNQLAACAGPVALFSIGVSMTRYSIRGDIGTASAIAGLKLFALPAFVYLLSRLFGLTDDWTAALVLTASVPTGINAWLIAQRFRSGQALAASSIAATTMLGVVTVTGWAWLLR